MVKHEYEIMILSKEQKQRLTKVTEGIIDYLEKNTTNLPEKAFVLRILMETFEETQNCIVPFNKRYTEPVYNYQNGFMEKKTGV